MYQARFQKSSESSPAALASEVATGIQFFPVTAQALTGAFARLGDLYAQPKVWKTMQRNAMKQRIDWATSAAQYQAIYASLTRDPK